MTKSTINREQKPFIRGKDYADRSSEPNRITDNAMKKRLLSIENCQIALIYWLS